MASAKKTKKKNMDRIKQLKAELLEQQTNILETRRKITACKELYQVMKIASELEPDYFEHSLVRQTLRRSVTTY